MIVLTDDFGRQTVFTGEKLVEETTYSTVTLKPQWLEMDVWRTESGNFVVQRTTFYCIRHRRLDCSKAEGYLLATASDKDTYFCSECNESRETEGGYAQLPRVAVDVFTTPKDLIRGFQNDNKKFSNLSRSVLATISEQDPRVDAEWSTVQVP